MELGAEKMPPLSTGEERRKCQAGSWKDSLGRRPGGHSAHPTRGLVGNEQVAVALSWASGEAAFPVVGWAFTAVIRKLLLRPCFGSSCLGLWKEPFIT